MPYEIKAIINVTGTRCIKPNKEDCQFVQHFCDADDGPFTMCGLFTESIDDPADKYGVFGYVPALRCKACLKAEEEFQKKGLQDYE